MVEIWILNHIMLILLLNEPTVTGLVGRNAYGCLPCGFTQPASGTTAQ